MIASCRCFSVFSAAAYSSLLSTRLDSGMSATDLGSVRVSRGGSALITEARPVPAAVIWSPATSAKVESLCVLVTRVLPHLRKASPDSPTHSTRSM
ncbi:hypothetical protein C4B68_10735 [Streptomyces dengpaensis]|uniref:Secreted protein n=1 Tax=Streptomyces dengpaensis TaxID=2049881 RepID=A0ABN5HYJ9_9ACTN|nr:hypothetical protein C4B68_10735 [Streptomyces dengpaensis]